MVIVKGFSQRFKKNYTGSISVEAALVIPTLFLILVTLILFMMIMYQKALLTEVASMAAQQGAEVWLDSRKAVWDGAWDNELESDNTYYRILNDSLLSTFDFKEQLQSMDDIRNKYNEVRNDKSKDIEGKKIEEIREAIYFGLLRGLIKSKSTNINIEFKNTIVQREIKVTLAQEINIPLGGVKALFDGKRSVTLTGTGTAIVAEPAEYIRNVDLLMEYASRLKGSIDFQGKLKELKDKLPKSR